MAAVEAGPIKHQSRRPRAALRGEPVAGAWIPGWRHSPAGLQGV